LALLDEHIDGKYEILEKLREGGMGAIYKVRHRLLDEVRVVKVIRAHMATSRDAGDRFLREARVAIRLRHANIAQLHDFAVGTDGNAFIVMEFIDGWTLQEILRRHGPPPVALSLEIARQALKALGYLHRQKIVHRDVSPDNLMLTRDADGHPLVKLIDLGIAKAFEGGAGGLTTTGVFLGKPRYAAPEQFSGSGLDARSDLYSFGVVFYELLTGRCPIAGNDPPSYMAGHLLRPPLSFAESDPARRVPPALRETVLGMLAKEPNQRSASAEELLWALTMVQDQLDPPSTAELEAILHPPPLPEEDAALPPRPGSTQDRLDQEFWLTGGTVIEPVRTQKLPDAATVVVRPARLESPDSPDGRSVLDDMTWVTRRSVRPELPLDAPRAAAPPPEPGKPDAPGSSRPKIALVAGAALLALLLTGGFWWSQRPRPVLEKTTVTVDVPVEVQPAAMPAAMPVSSPAAPAAAETEEFRAAATPAPSPRKIVAPNPADPVPATPPPPMQRGDLIRRGLPNVQEAEPIEFPKYSYPEAARGSGKTARVRVAVLVDESGKVIEALVQEGDGSGLGFNEAALEAARRVPYQPATRDDVPGRMWTELIFEFAE
jgi:serine/threonine-protein kinase